MNSSIVIEAQNLGYSIDEKTILKNIQFQLYQGETLFVIGPNGSGKSTLLRLFDGLIHPTSGKILLHGKSIFEIPRKLLAQKIAWLPQQLSTSLSWSVWDFIAMARFPWKNMWQQDSKSDFNIISDVLQKAGIEHLKTRMLETLSGGEKQRVSLAALLVQQADLFLLDEPSSFLDPKQDSEIQVLLQKIQNDTHTTAIQISHDFQKPFPKNSRILALKNGSMHFIGSRDEFLTQKIADQVFEIPFIQMKHPQNKEPFLIPENLI